MHLRPLTPLLARFGFMGLGLIVAIVWLVATNSAGKAWILVEYTMAAGDCEGAVVSIDGEPAGTLNRVGNARRNSFKVDAGPRSVRIEHPELPCRELELDLAEGATMMVIVEYEGVWVDGAEQAGLCFTY